MIDSALAGVNARITSGPEILRITVLVVPPGIGDSIKFEWRVVAIVLMCIPNMYFQLDESCNKTIKITLMD